MARIEGLWKVMKDFNFDEDLIQVMAALYDNATTAVHLGDSLGDFFRTSVALDKEGGILSPFLFNVFLENIMQEALQKHQTSWRSG